ARQQLERMQRANGGLGKVTRTTGAARNGKRTKLDILVRDQNIVAQVRHVQLSQGDPPCLPIVFRELVQIGRLSPVAAQKILLRNGGQSYQFSQARAKLATGCGRVWRRVHREERIAVAPRLQASFDASSSICGG